MMHVMRKRRGAEGGGAFISKMDGVLRLSFEIIGAHAQHHKLFNCMHETRHPLQYMGLLVLQGM